MKYRKLGNSDIVVSEIGFGAWGIGGLSKGATSYGKTDDDESKKALKKAYDQCVTFFDTSDIYGNGHSEKLIGETLEDVREKVIISSKVGFLEHNGPQDFSPKYINNSLENTLRRLKTSYLDLYQLHNPPIEIFEGRPEIIETLLDLKEKGKIKAYGISARSPEEAVIAAEKYSFNTIQVNFNLADQRVLGTRLFDICKKKDIGVICRTPLCFGFLSGNYSEDKKFDSADHRSTWPDKQRELWANAYNLFLEAIDKKVKQTHVQVALRFCLSYDVVSTVIPGMLNEKEVVENVYASQLDTLRKDEKLKLEKIFKNNKFFIGKGN